MIRDWQNVDRIVMYHMVKIRLIKNNNNNINNNDI